MPTRSPLRSDRNSQKDAPLVNDIRLLGKLLGQVIREQEGQAAYDLVEQIRKLSVAYRRDSDTQADKALQHMLRKVSSDSTVMVIRAFTILATLPI